MARSHLIQVLRQAYARSRTLPQWAALHSPPSPEAILNQPMSRRRVLQGGLLTVGALGLKPGGVARWRLPSAEAAKVLVVGAGVAGLTVAYRLQQAGIFADVVEASPRVGGRLRSLSQLVGSDDVVELGGEFIDTQHTAVRSLANELGLEMVDLRLADEGLAAEVLYFGGKTISQDWVIDAFAPLAERISHDLAQLTKRDLSYRNPSRIAKQLDRLSLSQYLDSADVDPLIKKLVEVAYITEYGRDADDQTCLNMLFLIGAEVGKWSTYGVSDERWHVRGGNEQIPQALRQRLKQDVETDTRLEAIHNGGTNRYRVTLRQGSTSRDRTYDAVVLAVPFSLLRHVNLAIDLPPLKRQAIQQLGYGTCSKLAVPFYERIWRDRYRSTISIYTDQPFQNTWESARYRQGSVGWVTDLRGGTEGLKLGGGDISVHADRLTQSLNALFPGIDQVKRVEALRAFWAAEPYALGSYSCYLPGQWTTFGGIEGESVGNLWFAGEHCSLASQGYMNGAVETAEVAAQKVLQRLGSQVI
ncbi:FAD-dependent oxidoreductase [Leptolyngbya sp. AN02str]|uniref:flavin monoamine oxidase family protein n=1 Tax=Leptolyngbya sp. AN02str TaxID=3423363 RepID=UPI003D3227C8